MSKRKYKKGRVIRTMCGFENSKSKWFIWNEKTVNRGVLESLQYRTLKNHLSEGKIYTAVKIGG